MNVFTHFRQEIITALQQLTASGGLPPGLDFAKVTAEPPRDPSHGDISTNAAMVLAKPASKAPRAIAEPLVKALSNLPNVKDCTIAGPGFINLKIIDSFWYDRLTEILASGVNYGDSTLGADEKINIEYVSVNPTGPMHVGHCRVAVVADVLASLMQKAGYNVTREFYVNDAGSQADHLAKSVYQRYREALGKTIEESLEYPGDYLMPVGKALADRDGDQWLDQPESSWLETFRHFSIAAMMELIKHDLGLINIQHDIFTSEQSIIDRGEVDQAFEFLENQGLIYTGVLEPPKGKQLDDWEPRPQTLFRSTKFGDDVDRALKKSDGKWTYFASDIAYHFDKARRGFTKLIDVWGADHGGYVKRITAATSAITKEQITLEAKLCQLVKFMDQGKPVKMSKRGGTFIAVKDLIERVGSDVVRFIMVTRKNDAPLDFDFAKVVEHSKDNPVFYVQYAHARTCSVMRHASEAFPDLDIAQADLSLLSHPDEINLIKLLAGWPRQIEIAAEVREPHRIAFFLYDIAAAFHALWTKGREDSELRFLFPENKELTTAKLALLKAVQNVIASGLMVIGVTPVEEMR